MHLVGVDIGFSERRRSNALVVYRDGSLICPPPLSVAERNAALQELRNVDVVAIDAPLLRPGTPTTLPRECERHFSRGLFQRRCKPGMSHVRGTGQLLREHGRQAAECVLTASTQLEVAASFPRVYPNAGIVEAFPNAFLGVVVPDEDFANAGRIPRGGKFDWLYDRWIARGLFRTIADAAQLPENIAARCESEKDHDIRAALVCLLTAAFVASGSYGSIGDEAGGWFFLPPLEIWSSWMRNPKA